MLWFVGKFVISVWFSFSWLNDICVKVVKLLYLVLKLFSVSLIFSV